MRKFNLAFFPSLLFLLLSIPGFIFATGMEDGQESKKDRRKPGNGSVTQCSPCSLNYGIEKIVYLVPDKFPFSIDKSKARVTGVNRSMFNLSLPIDYTLSTGPGASHVNLSYITESDLIDGKLPLMFQSYVYFCGGLGNVPNHIYEFTYKVVGDEYNQSNGSWEYFEVSLDSYLDPIPNCPSLFDDGGNGGEDTPDPFPLRATNQSFDQPLVNLYPTLTTGELTLSLNLSLRSYVKVNLYNTVGQLVKSNSINREFSAGIHEEPLDLTALVPGFYHARIEIGKTIKNIKFQKIE